jgi:hypothetical protein
VDRCENGSEIPDSIKGRKYNGLSKYQVLERINCMQTGKERQHELRKN